LAAKPSAAATLTHISLRPQITLEPPNPCFGILSTFEIVDATSGRTNGIAQAFLPVPALQQSPPPPIRFGFASTTSADILRLNVVNTALSSQAGVCQIQAGFLDASSKDPATMQTATLGPGQSLILNQAGGAWLRPILRYPPDPCLGIIATVENVDAAADFTRFFFPPNPI
jgi:hypothetical protein